MPDDEVVSSATDWSAQRRLDDMEKDLKAVTGIVGTVVAAISDMQKMFDAHNKMLNTLLELIKLKENKRV